MDAAADVLQGPEQAFAPVPSRCVIHTKRINSKHKMNSFVSPFSGGNVCLRECMMQQINPSHINHRLAKVTASS